MCQHIYAELSETTQGLGEDEVKEAVKGFCETLDEEIVDAVFDICNDFMQEHGEAIAENLIKGTAIATACHDFHVCDEGMGVFSEEVDFDADEDDQ